MVILATAHPAKFQTRCVRQVIRKIRRCPLHMQDLFDGAERCCAVCQKIWRRCIDS